MKIVLSALLFLFGSLAPIHAKTPKPTVEETLLQLENDWSAADKHRDAAALNRILAEDWIGIDFEGTVLNKEQALRGIASGSGELDSTVLRDMKVRVYGNTAVITGTDTERGEYHGQDSSGRYVWTDVFVRRNGRWQAVSSQSTRLSGPPDPRKIAKFLPRR